MINTEFMDNFIKNYLGTKDDYDGGYGVQCVDAAKRGMKLLGISTPPATGTGWASGYWYNYSSIPTLKNNFKKIERGEKLEVGDMLLWDCPHVGWYVGNDKVFSQNQRGKNDGYSIVDCKNFRGYLGALRYRFFASKKSNPLPPNKTIKNYGVVTCDVLNVRVWAGVEYTKFSKVKRGDKIGICDVRYDTHGDKWYYMIFNGKYGFVFSDYIKEV